MADRPRPLAGQRQPGLGQRGQVAGANRAEPVDERQGAVRERLRQRRRQPRMGAGTAGGQLVQPDQQHRSYVRSRQRTSTAAGVAAQQPQAVVAGGLRRDRLVTVRADAGRTSIDVPAGGEVAGQLPRLFSPADRLVVQLDPRLPVPTSATSAQVNARPSTRTTASAISTAYQGPRVPARGPAALYLGRSVARLPAEHHNLQDDQPDMRDSRQNAGHHHAESRIAAPEEDVRRCQQKRAPTQRGCDSPGDMPLTAGKTASNQ